MDHLAARHLRLQRNFTRLVNDLDVNNHAARHLRLQRNFTRLVNDLDVNNHAADRPRAAVVSWDLTHNPVGRALVLAELLDHEWGVDLIGPMWTQYGTSLWAPVDGEIASIRTFPASTIVDYLPAAVATAVSQRYDLVVASKYRLPAIHLATMIAEWSDAPLVVDMCDLESAVAPPVEEGPADSIDSLFDGPARRLEERSIELADARTVVGPTLHDRFGGHIVRHARRPSFPVDTPEAEAARSTARDRFSIPSGESAVFYIGTVRPHKGVHDVVEAIREISDIEIRLHLFTTTSDEELDEMLGADREQWVNHGHCRLRDIPAILSAADLVVIAQDPGSEIARYQVPAKISDAGLLGCTVLAPALPAYADLIEAGLIETFAPGGLAARIRELALRADDREARRERQLLAKAEFSLTANAGRLTTAIVEAERTHRTGPRDSLILHDELIDLYERKRPITWLDEVGTEAPPNAPDIAFFWKQNDSDLYGRRHDMIIRYAIANGHVGRSIQFDRPVDVTALATNIPVRAGALPSNDQFLLRSAIERHLALRDEPRLTRRTFLHRGDGPAQGGLIFGRPIPPRSGGLEWIRRQLESAAITPEGSILWLWPHIDAVEELITAFAWAKVVVDLVDDERTWPHLDGDRRGALHASYVTALRNADVVFTNSEANARAFADLRDDILVVPNGTEPAAPLDPTPRARPRIGYVGDMQHRVDWDLLDAVARAHRECDIHLIGEVTDDSEAHTLAAQYDHVKLFGVVPYKQSRELMADFDVALVPHELSDQSLQMDPLKLYNYLAVGVPVVATPHPTANRFASHVRTAATTGEFLAHVAAALTAPRPDPIGVADFSWPTRVDTLFDHITDAEAPR